MKTLLILAFLLVESIVRSQDCSNYYYLQNNKTVEMSLFDKKGNITGKVLYSIIDVKNSNVYYQRNIADAHARQKGQNNW